MLVVLLCLLRLNNETSIDLGVVLAFLFDLVKDWQVRDWAAVISCIAIVLGLYLSRKPKFNETDSYKVFKDAKLLKDDELEMMLQDAEIHQKWLQTKSEQEQDRIGRDFEFYGYVETLKQKHLGERYFAKLAKFNQTLTKLIDDNAEPIKQPQNSWQKLNKSFFEIMPFSPQGYSWCLLIAIVYPLLLVLINWLFTGDMQLANVQLAQGDSVSDRLFSLMALIGMGWAMFKAYKAEQAKKLKQVFIYFMGLFFLIWIFFFLVDDSKLNSIVFAGFVPGVVASAFAGAISINGVVAFVGFLAVTVTVAGAFIGAFGGVFVGALAFFILLFILPIKYKSVMTKWLKTYLFSLSVLTPVLVSGVILYGLSQIDEPDKNLDRLLITIVFGILPFTNAVVDWLSLSVTRGMLVKLQMGSHSRAKWVGFALADLLLAIGFIFVVMASSLTVLGGFNSIAHIYTGNSLIDFSLLMEQVQNPETAANTVWLHMMLLTTIIPTLIHFALVFYAIALGRGHSEVEQKLRQIYSGNTKVREWAYKYYHNAKWWTAFYLVLLIGVIGLMLYHWHWPLWQMWRADTVLNMVDSTYLTPIS